MDWLDRMNGAVSFIEEHLTEELDIEEVARKACCSVYQFQRMFSFITEVPLSEYIRRRRLTLAAFELQGSEIKIIDLALKYGYESPISFTRAFQNQHGVTPSLARGKSVQLTAYSRISFQISIVGDVEMNYKIVEKESFLVVGKREKQSNSDEISSKGIPAFWDECHKNGTIQRLLEFNDANKSTGFGKCIFGICDATSDNAKAFDYWIAAKKPDNLPVSGFESLNIPKTNWLVFESKGAMPDAIQMLWKRIFSEFLPTSGYERADGPDLEVYYEGNMDSCDYRSEIWVPVMKIERRKGIEKLFVG